MSEADKMFMELGYKKVDNGEQVFYVKSDKEIKFNKWLRCICSIDSNYKWQYIDMQELKAINKKCEELRWI